jgi:DNA replication protein DnaC
VREHENVLIVGATGTGKTYLACALAHKACLEGFTARYERLSRLFDKHALARADGTYGKLVRDLAKTDVVVLDDWGLAPITSAGRYDLLEILDDRHGHRSTIVTSQLPVAEWHASIGDATLADAILDRVIHNAHRITLKGDSMRRRRGPSSESDIPNA